MGSTAFRGTAANGVNASKQRMPVLFVTHGGGPMPLLNDPGHAKLTAYLQQVASRMPKPKQILIVTAHWQAQQPTVSSAAQHELLYDYGGFPPEAYRIKYGAPGSPDLAARAVQLLRDAGFKAGSDSKRGWDHGVFVPLKLMYGDATTPIVALSLLSSADPAEHIRMGDALAPLRDEGVLIVGSGANYHNLRTLFGASSREEGLRIARAHGEAFDEFLCSACCDDSVPYSQRAQRLINWTAAPHAHDAHPKGGEEHLLPLMVCFGAAKDGAPAKLDFHEAIMAVNGSDGVKAACFLFP